MGTYGYGISEYLRLINIKPESYSNTHQMSESLSSSVFPGQSDVENFKKPQKSKENSDHNRTLLEQHFHSIKKANEMPSFSNTKGHTDQQQPSFNSLDAYLYVNETYGISLKTSFSRERCCQKE